MVQIAGRIISDSGEVTWLLSTNQQPNTHACALLAVATVLLPVSPELLLDSATFVMRLNVQFVVTYCEPRCAAIHFAIRIYTLNQILFRRLCSINFD